MKVKTERQRETAPRGDFPIPRFSESGSCGGAAIKTSAFTLVELLVAMVVTLLLMILVMQMLGSSSKQWKQVSENAKAFQGARTAFESLTRNLSQAVLATEFDYYNTSRESRLQLATEPDGAANLASFTPAFYGRSSSLHFISGKNLKPNQHSHALFFQAPLDFDPSATEETTAGQLNALGYFIHYGSDEANRPAHLTSSLFNARFRFRLMQYLQPTSKLEVYRSLSGTTWFNADLDGTASTAVNAHPIAENIILLVLLPKLPDEQGKPLDAIAPLFEYDSRTPWTSGSQPVQMHQLPPIVRVLMIAIDEPSAQRDPELGKEFATLFRTPGDFASDLQEVEETLRQRRANYRVFQTDVPIRSAKWSQ